MKKRVIIMTRSFGSTTQEPWKMIEEAECETVKLDIGKTTDAEIAAEMAKSDGMIIGARQITRQMIESGSRLKVICMHGVGVDHIDRQACKDHGVIVANCPGANSDGVADLTVGLMLSVARSIPQNHNSLVSGSWEAKTGVEIFEKTLGLIGLGKIGKGVALRVSGFRMKILVHDPFLSSQEIEAIGAKPATVDEILKESDFISLHAPLTDDTRYLINKESLVKMKKSAYLINTARGELVNEEDLYTALVNKEIAGAALDAFSKEPPADTPLLHLPNIIVTPHIGAKSIESTTRMSVMSARNVIEVLQTGKALWSVG